MAAGELKRLAQRGMSTKTDKQQCKNGLMVSQIRPSEIGLVQIVSKAKRIGSQQKYYI
jgi:hypothetical protein